MIVPGIDLREDERESARCSMRYEHVKLTLASLTKIDKVEQASMRRVNSRKLLHLNSSLPIYHSAHASMEMNQPYRNQGHAPKAMRKG